MHFIGRSSSSPLQGPSRTAKYLVPSQCSLGLPESYLLLVLKSPAGCRISRDRSLFPNALPALCPSEAPPVSTEDVANFLVPPSWEELLVLMLIGKCGVLWLNYCFHL